MRSAAIALAIVSCGVFHDDPTTFPATRTGVSCRAMVSGQWGCTERDGHHRLTIRVEGREVTLSDLGQTWGQIGPWHQIGDHDLTWCEDRCADDARD